MVHTIVRQRRERWYARIHNGAIEKPYTDELRQARVGYWISNEYTGSYQDLERKAYVMWRESCLFTGLRPDWMRLCPDRERALHAEFNRLDEFKRVWKARVTGLKLFRQSSINRKRLWRVMLRKTQIQTMWQDNGGHLHRMPPHLFRQMVMNALVSSPYFVRFLVLLMKIRSFRVRLYALDDINMNLETLEREYPEESERARESCVEYVEPSEPEMRIHFDFRSFDELIKLDRAD
jgi:hypothetical protein